jgi:DNA-binding CsgD family transcriptional regulator
MVEKSETSRRGGAEKAPQAGVSVGRVSRVVDSDLIWDVLDCFTLGTVVLRKGRVVAGLNRAADEILQQRDGLYIDGGVLRALDPTDDALLESLVAYSTNSPGRRAPSFLQVTRTNDHRPYDVCIAKVSSPASAAGTAVFLYDQDSSVSSVFTLARSLFNLTAAEARVVQGLAEGSSLYEIAAELRISPHTVRTHLKNVFAKTETRRQSDLLRLVVSGLGALSLDGDR